MVVIFSVITQPLDVNSKPAEQRSLVWGLFFDATHRAGPAADFFAVYHAGGVIKAGGNPYVWPTAATKAPYYYPYRYLPVVAQSLGRIFTFFTPRSAYFIWCAMLEVTVFFILWLILTHFQITPRWQWILLPILLLSSPYFLEVHIGQFTFVSTALAVTALIMAEKSSSQQKKTILLASASFLAAVLLKIFPLAILPCFLKSR